MRSVLSARGDERDREQRHRTVGRVARLQRVHRQLVSTQVMKALASLFDALWRCQTAPFC
jgi:hypothetical protein